MKIKKTVEKSDFFCRIRRLSEEVDFLSQENRRIKSDFSFILYISST